MRGGKENRKKGCRWSRLPFVLVVQSNIKIKIVAVPLLPFDNARDREETKRKNAFFKGTHWQVPSMGPIASSHFTLAWFFIYFPDPFFIILDFVNLLFHTLPMYSLTFI